MRANSALGVAAARHAAHAGRVHRAARHPEQHGRRPRRRHVRPDLDPQLDEHRAGGGAALDRDGRRRPRPAADLRGRVLVLAVWPPCWAPSRPTSCSFVLRGWLQGVGGAAVIASSLGIIAATFPPGPGGPRPAACGGRASAPASRSGRCSRRASTAGTTGATSYGVLGAAALLVALAAGRGSPSRARSRRRRPDVPGVVLLAAGMSALLAALVEGRQDWTRPVVYGLGGRERRAARRLRGRRAPLPRGRCSTSRCSGSRPSSPRRSRRWPPAPA